MIKGLDLLIKAAEVLKLRPRPSFSLPWPGLVGRRDALVRDGHIFIIRMSSALMSHQVVSSIWQILPPCPSSVTFTPFACDALPLQVDPDRRGLFVEV